MYFKRLMDGMDEIWGFVYYLSTESAHNTDFDKAIKRIE